MASVILDDVTQVTGEYVELDGERYYRISNAHLMDDFFMSLVGADDHWMFISSNGALTTGRRNPDTALFPYAADDQISNARGNTGSVTLVRVKSKSDQPTLWEPFAAHSAQPWQIRRNLYKTPLGNKLVLEEVNETLQLTFRYRWTFSHRFGFIRSCRLENTGDNPCSLELVDGIRNVLPYGVESEFIMRFSNLANAYKKSELIANSDIGLFYLSSIPSDRAEPSEGLKSTVVWQTGLDPDATLLSGEQLTAFRSGDIVQTERELRGTAGAYLLNQSVDLPPNEPLSWHVVAEVAQDHSQIVALDDWLQKTSSAAVELDKDVEESEEQLLAIIASSDGLQCSSNDRRANRHLSNTVFNAMRGGIPLENYGVQKDDFCQHVENANKGVYEKHASFLEGLPSVIDITELCDRIAEQNDSDLRRLGLEYLPLAFSRRHGDPTRPWNRFSIELRSESGRTNLNYQGNWRDIFQNWEALGHSFPKFTTAMICRFVNATTADGYNPYRLTKSGFEWEEPAPDDPWANIGYWGDHQIIYLLKLIEWSRRFDPQQLDSLLNSRLFVHANVPYRIKSYAGIRSDARDTIVFDTDSAETIRNQVAEIGADGKLVRNQDSEIHRINLVEKFLTLSLAKLSNFVPDGGIWLNTQRPEWNDANNALVGSGLSMVTASYLHRWFVTLSDWFSEQSEDTFEISKEVAAFMNAIATSLAQHSGADGAMDAKSRLAMVEALSKAGCAYRAELYTTGFSGETDSVSKQACLDLFASSRSCLESTIRNNRRKDGLYHAYNLLDWQEDGLEIEPLYEMLEGQVAVLSSGLLSAKEAVELLDALRASSLYRANQDSYLLYPDRRLPTFLEKNLVDSRLADSNSLLNKLLSNDRQRIVSRDVRGGIHFNGDFRNSADLRAAMDGLDDEYDKVVAESGAELVQAFDDLFGHRKFTGRSGTFFAYEGLGSIYWHMVSKLVLAVSENAFAAKRKGEDQNVIDSLHTHYCAIRSGIGAEKDPVGYGAFPSDPYSHTPENAGVKQPGMTGQVKEDILSRFSEVGVHIENGCLGFNLELFDRKELLSEPKDFTFYNVANGRQTMKVPQNGFAFLLFQVPVIYQPGEKDSIRLVFGDGQQQDFDGTCIDAASSRRLFARSGEVKEIHCRFTALRK